MERKGKDVVWPHNSITKILNSEYNTKYTTNKNKQITKRTPKCKMSFMFVNVNSNAFAEVSTNNHFRLCNSNINITFMFVETYPLL